MQYLKTGSPIPNWRELRLTPVCLLPSVGTAFLAFFYALFVRGDEVSKPVIGQLERVQMTLTLIGSCGHALLRWHGASSRGSQPWPQPSLLEISWLA